MSKKIARQLPDRSANRQAQAEFAHGRPVAAQTRCASFASAEKVARRIAGLSGIGMAAATP